MDVSTRIRGERSGFHVRSVQNFVRLGRAGGIPILQREFRRLRAASDFAPGGKVTKTPPGTHPMGYGSASLRLGP